MKVSVYSVPRKLDRKKIKKATQMIGQQILGRLYPKVSVHVRFLKIHQNGAAAECFPIDDLVRPREFQINIDPRNSETEILEFIAHELVHLKQYAKEELYNYLIQSGIRWRGKRYDVGMGYDDYTYFKLPWEVEAYGMQKCLADIYRKSYNYEYEDGKYLSV
jgi:hypothetical protein